ncbi:MAG: ABC transporter permease [Spirochaetes bacterium]|nr:MAG: ABC transporter permease [Spirochaetota bacterium]
MTRYILQKIVFSIITLFIILTVNFFIFRVVPGDPISMMLSPRTRPEIREHIREQYGVDKPLWINTEAFQEEKKISALFDTQYYHYFCSLAKGELGYSFKQKKPVTELIGQRVGPTVLLIFTGEVIAIFFGVFLGMLAAWKARSKVDTLVLITGLTAWSMPPFWLGLILLTMARGLFPSGGFITIGATFSSTIAMWLDIGKHLVLPATTMAILLFGAYAITVRNSALEVLAEDYIKTAKAKGLSQKRVLRSHALKNASLPLVTMIAMDLGFAMGGSIQIETIFSYPGLGRLMFEAIMQRDYPVLQGVFLLLAVTLIAANLLADLTYIILDPRIRE